MTNFLQRWAIGWVSETFFSHIHVASRSSCCCWLPPSCILGVVSTSSHNRNIFKKLSKQNRQMREYVHKRYAVEEEEMRRKTWLWWCPSCVIIGQKVPQIWCLLVVRVACFSLIVAPNVLHAPRLDIVIMSFQFSHIIFCEKTWQYWLLPRPLCYQQHWCCCVGRCTLQNYWWCSKSYSSWLCKLRGGCD